MAAGLVLLFWGLTSNVPDGTYELNYIHFNKMNYTPEEFQDVIIAMGDEGEIFEEDFLGMSTATFKIAGNNMIFLGADVVEFDCSWGNIKTKGLSEIAILQSLGYIDIKYSYGKIIVEYDFIKILDLTEEIMGTLPYEIKIGIEALRGFKLVYSR